MLRSLWLAIAFSSLAHASVAHAQAAEQASPAQIRAAAEAFDIGREAYQRQDYVAAAEQFERADSQAQSPTAIEYAIRARDKAGQLDRAATLAALAEGRHPEVRSLVKLAQDVLARGRARLHELRVRCLEHCDLAVDGKIVHGRSATERVVYLLEGPHSLRAGFSNDRSASSAVAAGKATQSEVSLEPPAAEAAAVDIPAPAPARTPPTFPEEQVRSGGWSPTVFWVGAGVTAAAAGVTVWSGVDTLNNPGEDRIHRVCRDTDCELYQDGLRRQRRTNVLLGVTAGLGLATALVGTIATDWSGGSERVGAFEPYLEVGGGALLGARGRF